VSNPITDLIALARDILTLRTARGQLTEVEIGQRRARIRALAADGRIRAENVRDKRSIDELLGHALTLLTARTPSVLILTGPTPATARLARTTNPEALARLIDCYESTLSRLADDIDAEERLALSQRANEATTANAGAAEDARPPDPPVSLRRVGEVWHLRYHDEEADYPVKGNQFIGWLAKLLDKPNRTWTVAELRGDPDGKLKADASLGGQPITDEESLQKIQDHIEDIDATIEATGGSEALEEQKARLLGQVADCAKRRRIISPLSKAYGNIQTQKSLFLTKLKAEMPQLGTHLRACIIFSGKDYTIAYRPPSNAPLWQVENSTA
jgi:hypothetical protein